MEPEASAASSSSSSLPDPLSLLPSSRVPAHLISSLKGIFFSEFHSDAGRQIVCTVPEAVEGLEDFDQWSAYVLPKRELMGNPITFVMKEKDICLMGQPMELQSERYPRNAYLFNLCLVTSAGSLVQQLYQPIAQKMGAYLAALELECHFLSGPDKERLPGIVRELYESLRSTGRAHIPVSRHTTISVALVWPRGAASLPGTADVQPSLVPVFVRSPPSDSELPSMDVLSQKLVRLINGRRSVGEISAKVEVDAELVARTLKHLEHFGLVLLLPPFLYRNVYVATARLHLLFTCAELQKEAVAFVALASAEEAGSGPRWEWVFRLYASLRAGLPMSEWCLREEPRSLGVDEHRLVQFGLIRGLVREVRAFPVYTGREEEREAWEWELDGHKSLSELAHVKGLQASDFDALLQTHSDRIAVIWK